MIQDIAPIQFYNEFLQVKPSPGSVVFCFDDQTVYLKNQEEGKAAFPHFSQLDKKDQDRVAFLFTIDSQSYFICTRDLEGAISGFSFCPVRVLRDWKDKTFMFAGATAYHLFTWYRSNRYCGHCGSELKHDTKQRMLLCTCCHNMVFPKIAPAVIVAVTDHDRILMTKYNGRSYQKYALIAGFTEIGETLEETVAREVMEEVGLRVKNIRYYKSQPWGFDSNLLTGFFAELDGNDKITREEEELSEADWFERNQMPIEDDGISLTREMMRVFQNGKEWDF